MDIQYHQPLLENHTIGLPYHHQLIIKSDEILVVQNIGKTSRNIPTKKHLKMVGGSVYLPKESYSRPQGEDAHFICIARQTMGIADGVGGWTKKGVDSGEYARELMTNSLISIQQQSQRVVVNPLRVLFDAYFSTNVEGSSTACIITLNQNTIQAVNIGDSGFMIIRSGKVVYKSPIQQRSFNCPYQLRKCNDGPFEAQILEFEVEPGDVIVAGTDGLFDNMDKEEIKEVIVEKIKEGESPEQLACLIANYALYNSFDRYANTPYSRASKRAKRSHSGGKVDDITVIVAFIAHI